MRARAPPTRAAAAAQDASHTLLWLCHFVVALLLLLVGVVATVDTRTGADGVLGAGDEEEEPWVDPSSITDMTSPRSTRRHMRVAVDVRAGTLARTRPCALTPTGRRGAREAT